MYQNELRHHGVKGQKWGVRRFQNADGSLTDAGKKRYTLHDKDVHNSAGIAYANIKHAKDQADILANPPKKDIYKYGAIAGIAEELQYDSNPSVQSTFRNVKNMMFGDGGQQSINEYSVYVHDNKSISKSIAQQEKVIKDSFKDSLDNALRKKYANDDGINTIKANVPDKLKKKTKELVDKCRNESNTFCLGTEALENARVISNNKNGELSSINNANKVYSSMINSLRKHNDTHNIDMWYALEKCIAENYGPESETPFPLKNMSPKEWDKISKSLRKYY